MIWVVYNILFAIGFLLMLPKFLWRMKRRGGYAKDFSQRFARYSPAFQETLSQGDHIWIHAVSVGEIFVAMKIMEALRRGHPGARFVLSTTTSTGYAIGTEKIRDPDVLIYFPIDAPPIMRRAFAVIRPKALILVEAEFWPNLVRRAHRQGVPIYLVNGRISPSSFRGYRRLRVFTRRIFPLFDLLCVQSAGDRERLLDLGAPRDRIHVLNSVKYEVADADPGAEQQAAAVLKRVGFAPDRQVLIGGSTWPGEEGCLLDAYMTLRDTHSSLALVLAPRHAERRADVVDEITRRGMQCQLRSELGEAGSPLPKPPDVFVIDTTGELKHFYPHAALIFIGKSLTSHGGQNIIEPALHGRPIIVGPNMENFPVVMEDFRGANAIRQVDGEHALPDAIAALLTDPDAARQMGKNAVVLVRDKRGGIQETVRLIGQRLYGTEVVNL